MKVSLRAASASDASLVSEWDMDPAVVASHQDDTSAYIAYSENDWATVFTTGEPGNTFLIAEADEQPVGVVQIVDPAREADSDWSEGFPPRMRALHTWIGPPEWRGQGVGAQMMAQALDLVFGDHEVDGILIDPLTSNTAAHRFYRRLGFRDLETRRHRTSDCLIMKLTRADWRAGDDNA